MNLVARNHQNPGVLKTSEKERFLQKPSKSKGHSSFCAGLREMGSREAPGRGAPGGPPGGPGAFGMCPL